MNLNKIWLKNYPKGISPEIKFDEFLSLNDMFEKTCDKFNDKIAFTNFGVEMSFKELKIKSTSLAFFLRNKLKLEKGSRVSILKAGLIVENINPLYTKRELELQIQDSKTDTIIILENFVHLIEESVKNNSIKNIIITSVGELLGIKGVMINFMIRK